MAIPKKLRQKNNEKAAKYFAAGVGGMMLLFVVFHVSLLHLSHACLEHTHDISFIML